jgi:hypothetical protein
MAVIIARKKGNNMILHCIDYNALQLRKHADKIWNPMWFFLNQHDGSYRMYGYVAFNDKRAEWRKTKKEAIACNVYDN